MESAVKQRIRRFIKQKNMSIRAFESSIGLSNGYISSIRVSIQPDKISKIALQYPELNTGWLLTGEGEMIRKGCDISTFGTECAREIPLIPIEAVAGFGTGDFDGISIVDCKGYAVPDFFDMNAEFMIRVSGSSMYPKYSNGDLLACKKVQEVTFFQWGKVYVLDTSQGAIVKRIFENPDDEDSVICVSENKANYPQFSLPKSEIRSLSIVLGAIRTE